nr:PREDICTED: collagen alpha-1(I) chain-like [Bos indicus]
MTDEGSPQEPSSPAFQMRLPSLPAWWVPLQSSGSEDTGSSSSEKSTQESRRMPWLRPWGWVASSAKPALETARPPPSPPFPASPASPPSGSQRSAALGLQVPRGAPACWGHVLPGPRRSRTPRALPGAPTCHVKRSRSAAPGRTPRGPGHVSFPGGPGEPPPLGASCRRGAGTAGARRRQLPRTARAMPGAFPSKSQSPRGPAARTPGRRGALGLGPGVLSRLRATPRLGMDTYAGVEWILQSFCSKCVLIQSVAFTNGTRKVLEVGRAAPLMGTV